MSGTGPTGRESDKPAFTVTDTTHRALGPLLVLKLGDALTVRLNFLWLFVIALMPLPTNILIENDPTTQTVGFYIGWMLLTSALLMLIQMHARRTPGMMDPHYLKTTEAAEARLRSLLITAVFGVCLAVAFVAPNAALWFLLLQIPVDWIASRLAARSHA